MMAILYKCRLCGTVFSNQEGARDTAVLALQIATCRDAMPLWRGKSGLPPEMLDTHNCADGSVGVADLIGGRESKP